MFNHEELLIKTIKKFAGEFNFIATIEKKGNHFYHNNASDKLCNLLNVTFENVKNRTLYDLHPLDQATERNQYYEQAWGGEEVFYKAKNALRTDTAAYAVLTPVLYQGRVIQLVLQVMPVNLIPVQLRGIA